jgi:hypothetical protein
MKEFDFIIVRKRRSGQERLSLSIDMSGADPSGREVISLHKEDSLFLLVNAREDKKGFSDVKPEGLDKNSFESDG